MRSEGMRISFINHYDVKIEDDTILGRNNHRYNQEKKIFCTHTTNQVNNYTMVNSREFALKLNKYLG